MPQKKIHICIIKASKFRYKKTHNVRQSSLAQNVLQTAEKEVLQCFLALSIVKNERHVNEIVLYNYITLRGNIINISNEQFLNMLSLIAHY